MSSEAKSRSLPDPRPFSAGFSRFSANLRSGVNPSMSDRTHLTTLPSGVRVATIEMPHMQSASIGFWTGTGSRQETAENNGVAHFIEHLLFKGTENRSGEDISRQIERLGASIDAFTTEDHTAYQVKGPAEQLEPLLDVMVDMFQHPRFEPDDLENERNVIHEEIAMVRDQPHAWQGKSTRSKSNPPRCWPVSRQPKPSRPGRSP